MIRVLVIARSSVVRAGMESLIASSGTLELAGALDLARTSAVDFPADIALVDADDILPDSLPDFARDLSLPIVLLTQTADLSNSSAALRAGIRGIISREAPPQEIEAAVQAVNAGLIVIAPASLSELLPAERAPLEALRESLSDRELEVLNLVAEGLSNKLIAQGLGISEHTVKTHLTAIFEKLGASTRTEAVSQAIRRGLVML